MYPFLKRSRIAFFIIAIGFLAAMLVVSILGLVLAFNITFPLIIIYCGVSVIFVIFYIVIVAKITKKVHQNRNMRVKDSKSIKKVRNDYVAKKPLPHPGHIRKIYSDAVKYCSLRELGNIIKVLTSLIL